jgi:hypothetical protein
LRRSEPTTFRTFARAIGGDVDRLVLPVAGRRRFVLRAETVRDMRADDTVGDEIGLQRRDVHALTFEQSRDLPCGRVGGSESLVLRFGLVAERRQPRRVHLATEHRQFSHSASERYPFRGPSSPRHSASNRSS